MKIRDPKPVSITRRLLAANAAVLALALLLAGPLPGLTHGHQPRIVANFRGAAQESVVQRIAAECRSRNFTTQVLDAAPKVRVVCLTTRLYKPADGSLRAKPGSDKHPHEIDAFYFEVAAKGPDSVVEEYMIRSVFDSIHASQATKGEIAAAERVNARAGRMLVDLGGELQPMPAIAAKP